MARLTIGTAKDCSKLLSIHGARNRTPLKLMLPIRTPKIAPHEMFPYATIVVVAAMIPNPFVNAIVTVFACKANNVAAAVVTSAAGRTQTGIERNSAKG